MELERIEKDDVTEEVVAEVESVEEETEWSCNSTVIQVANKTLQNWLDFYYCSKVVTEM